MGFREKCPVLAAPGYRRAAAMGLAALGIAACGMTSLSARGRQVLPLESDAGSECALIAAVEGSADPLLGGLKSTEWLLESAQHDARNEAAKLGATHVRFSGVPARWPSGTFGGGQGLTVTGLAYRCGTAQGPQSAGATPNAAGCSKDTDCKGDRICEAGYCVNPRRPLAPSPQP